MRLIINLFLNTIAIIITAYIVPGFTVINFTTALLAAIILGIINTFIKPIFMLITAPINLLTLGLFTFVINAVMLWMVTLLVSGMRIDRPITAILAAIVLSVISTALSLLIRDLSKK